MNSLNWHLSAQTHTIHLQDVVHKHTLLQPSPPPPPPLPPSMTPSPTMVGIEYLQFLFYISPHCCWCYVFGRPLLVKCVSYVGASVSFDDKIIVSSIHHLLVLDFAVAFANVQCAFTFLFFSGIFLFLCAVRFPRPIFSGVHAVVVHTHTHSHTVFPIDLNVIINGIQHRSSHYCRLFSFFLSSLRFGLELRLR